MAEKKRKSGRPTVFTEEVIRKIEEVAALDGSVKEMAAYAGIHHDSIYAKMKADKRFSDRIETLRQNPVLLARRTFVGALNKPFYAVEYLRRKRRDEFADRQELTGAEGQPLVSITDLISAKLGRNRPAAKPDTNRS
jgi:hypothetical protein